MISSVMMTSYQTDSSQNVVNFDIGKNLQKLIVCELICVDTIEQFIDTLNVFKVNYL